MSDWLQTLLSVAVGGLIAYLSASATESRKWKREKEERRNEETREAAALALEWIDPMTNAHIRAESSALSFVRGDIPEEEYRKSYPRGLLDDLIPKDIPARRRVFLRTDAYPRGTAIIRSFQEGFTLALRTKGGDIGKNLLGVSSFMSALKEQIDSLEHDLRQEYRKTFD